MEYKFDKEILKDYENYLRISQAYSNLGYRLEGIKKRLRKNGITVSLESKINKINIKD